MNALRPTPIPRPARRCVLAALAAGTLALPLPAQTVLDHFTGTQVDQQIWWPFDDVQIMSVASSHLRFTGPPTSKHGGILSMDAFRGDFDFVLDFANFASTATSGWTSVKLAVIDAGERWDQLGEAQIKFEGNSSRSYFECNAERNNVSYPGASAASTTKGGELRLTRTTYKLTAAYRESSAIAWKTLYTWSDSRPFLRANDHVYVSVEGETADDGTSFVECDRITYVGQRRTSPVMYGSDCHGLRSRPYGIPYLGNPWFGIYVDGGSAFANLPILLVLGFSQLAIDLTPAGAPGCTLWASPDLLLLAPPMNGDGEGMLHLPVPNQPGFVGARIYTQFTALAKVNALGLAWSNGVNGQIVNP
jgi:hypothetical protein